MAGNKTAFAEGKKREPPVGDSPRGNRETQKGKPRSSNPRNRPGDSTFAAQTTSALIPAFSSSGLRTAPPFTVISRAPVKWGRRTSQSEPGAYSIRPNSLELPLLWFLPSRARLSLPYSSCRARVITQTKLQPHNRTVGKRDRPGALRRDRDCHWAACNLRDEILAMPELAGETTDIQPS